MPIYAIVKTGGKQYRVETGQTLLVEKLAVNEGATVDLEPLLYRGDEDVVTDGARLADVSVKATVIGHERGKKIRVFKFKPKRGYKRTAGHRQSLTRIQIAEVALGGARRSRVTAKPAEGGQAGARSARTSASKAESATKRPAAATDKPAASKSSPAKSAASKSAAESGKPAASKSSAESGKPAAPKRRPRRAAAKPAKPVQDKPDHKSDGDDDGS